MTDDQSLAMLERFSRLIGGHHTVASPELTPIYEEIASIGHRSFLAPRWKSVDWRTVEIPRGLSFRVAYNPKVTVNGCILKTETPNAFASRIDAEYCIGLSPSLQSLFSELAVALWSNPAFFPEVGEIDRLPSFHYPGEFTPLGFSFILGSKLDGRVPFIRPSVLAEREQWSSEIRRLTKAAQNMCEGRTYFAQHTIRAALRFVWWHELGHVVHGHCDFLRDAARIDRYGAVDYNSAFPAGDPGMNLLLQYMEYEADGYAANQMVHQTLDRLLVSLLIESADATATAEYELLCELMGAMLVFYSLGNLGFLTNPRLESEEQEPFLSSHPPYFVRLMTVAGSLGVYLERTKTEARRFRHADGHLVVPRPEQLEHVADRVRAALGRIVQNLRNIHPSLHNFCLGLSAEASEMATDYLQSCERATGFYEQLNGYRLIGKA
ncbi:MULTISPECIES: hypothetical protein [unclassified Bradyrhizobium]|uniref:hypothetical protein n=1 Tax=unclassified Bradyrhizobium TaxID=2631580 RepID=UPI0028EDEBD9|nr:MULTISPECIES: hypothetical protein [unclassified Bradyrhizobium]